MESTQLPRGLPGLAVRAYEEDASKARFESGCLQCWVTVSNTAVFLLHPFATKRETGCVYGWSRPWRLMFKPSSSSSWRKKYLKLQGEAGSQRNARFIHLQAINPVDPRSRRSHALSLESWCGCLVVRKVGKMRCWVQETYGFDAVDRHELVWKCTHLFPARFWEFPWSKLVPLDPQQQNDADAFSKSRAKGYWVWLQTSSVSSDEFSQVKDQKILSAKGCSSLVSNWKPFRILPRTYIF